MERMLRLLGVYFILVALPRVAVFANRFVPTAPEGWSVNPYQILGIFFALGLGLGVYVMTYFAASLSKKFQEEDVDEMSPKKRKEYERKLEIYQRQQIVAERARIGAFVFALLDSLFNLAEVASVAVAGGYIASIVRPVNGDIINLLAVWGFGLIPTFASALAGWVVSAVDQVPPQYRGGEGRELFIGKDNSKPAPPREVYTPQEPVSTYVPDNSSFQLSKPTNHRGARIRLGKKQFLQDYHSGDLAKFMAERGIQDLNAQALQTIYGTSERNAYRWLEEIQKIEEDLNNELVEEVVEEPVFTVSED